MELKRLPRRRLVLAGPAALAGAAAPSLLRAATLLVTPAQTEGPFYPDKLPLDTDNDLLIINETITPAVGDITHLSGRILDARGEPVRNAVVEIWQVDSRGAYLHSRGMSRTARDANFQGFGRFTTGSSGEYRFRTIKPVTYPGRTPHIHIKVKKGNRDLVTTQIFIDGHPQNERDGVLRSIRDAKERKLLMAEFKPVPGSKVGELAAKFDVVVGRTPAG